MEMRKQGYFLIALAFHLLCSTSYSQEKQSFAGLRGGITLPIGKYSQPALDRGSFALTGFNVSAEGAWFFHRNVGAGASAGLAMHPVDVGLLGREKVKADPFLQDVVIRSDPYLIITAMAGAFTDIPLKGKFRFTAKLLSGLLYGKTPYQLYKPEYFLVGPEYYEITSAKDWKFSWLAGAGLRYDISPCFGLVLDTDLVYDKLTFGFVTATGKRYEDHTISFVNITLGIRFNLTTGNLTE